MGPRRRAGACVRACVPPSVRPSVAGPRRPSPSAAPATCRPGALGRGRHRRSRPGPARPGPAPRPPGRSRSRGVRPAAAALPPAVPAVRPQPAGAAPAPAGPAASPTWRPAAPAASRPAPRPSARSGRADRRAPGVCCAAGPPASSPENLLRSRSRRWAPPAPPQPHANMAAAASAGSRGAGRQRRPSGDARPPPARRRAPSPPCARNARRRASPRPAASPGPALPRSAPLSPAPAPGPPGATPPAPPPRADGLGASVPRFLPRRPGLGAAMWAPRGSSLCRGPQRRAVGRGERRSGARRPRVPQPLRSVGRTLPRGRPSSAPTLVPHHGEASRVTRRACSRAKHPHVRAPAGRLGLTCLQEPGLSVHPGPLQVQLRPAWLSPAFDASRSPQQPPETPGALHTRGLPLTQLSAKGRLSFGCGQGAGVLIWRRTGQAQRRLLGTVRRNALSSRASSRSAG
ncbi:basic proline-rich protein-like isoform X2 [Cavia porcellus]|uniref:basic proline-rich protein-like isoform X2 n=1 Tax=Cavia porcellus TaxID=10141 RepID=UPI002FE35441